MILTRENGIFSSVFEQTNEEWSSEREVPDEKRTKAGPIAFPNEREMSVNFIISAFVRAADAEGDKVEGKKMFVLSLGWLIQLQFHSTPELMKLGMNRQV
jgi:hypothetical protein